MSFELYYRSGRTASEPESVLLLFNPFVPPDRSKFLSLFFFSTQLSHVGKKIESPSNLLFVFHSSFLSFFTKLISFEKEKNFPQVKTFLDEAVQLFFLLVIQLLNKFVALSPSICCLMSPFHSFVYVGVLDYGWRGWEVHLSRIFALHYRTFFGGGGSLPRNSN